MNKMLKRIILFGVLLSIGLIGNASAKEISFGGLNKSGAEVKVNAVLKLNSGESASQIYLKCGDTGNLDVSCSISGAGGILTAPTNGKYLFKKIDGGAFTEETVLATIILKNNSGVNTSGDLKIDYEIDGTDGVATTKYTIGTPKVVSTDSTLKDMSVSQGTLSPSWNPDTLEYVVYNIADTINSIKFNHTCNAGACTVKYEGGKSVSGNTIALNQGENIISALVTAEDGKTTSTYSFTVYRGESAFNSAKLSSLSIGTYKLDPEFDPNTKEYAVTVAYDIANLTDVLQYELHDPKASAVVKGQDNLVVGENTVTVEVTSQLGNETVTYTIKVTRMDNDEIKVLAYKDGNVTYKDAKGEEHTVALSEFKNAYPAEYKKIVNKIYKFDSEGNIIEDEDDSESKGLSKTTLLIILIIVGMAAIGASGYFIFRKPKPKADKKDKKDKKKKKKDEEETEEKEDEEPKELGESFADDEDATVSIDVALNDLMNTKQYEFEESEEKKDEEE